MATPVVFNAVSYSIPAFGDVGYAQGPGNLSAYLIAIATGTLQPTGGLFSLTADANFGPNFGLISVYYKSASANIATAGVLRLANTDTIDWRNFANTLNLPLAVNASDQLTFNGNILSTSGVNGTVNSGVAGRLTLYPASGNTVDDVYIQNSQNIDVLIAAQAARSTGLEYTIPNPGNAVAAATFALLELAQTFTAAQTFAQTVTISAVTNQLVLGTTNTYTITAPAPAASRTYTIPDVLGAASFVMTAGAQTIGGIKTFNAGAGAITMSGSTIAMGANKITGLANGTAATDAMAFGQNHVFQVVAAATTTTFSTTLLTFQTTNLTATITPTSASSKILILASSLIQNGGSVVVSCAMTIARGGSNILGTNGQVTAGFSTGTNNAVSQGATLSYLDSPASTLSQTYAIQIFSSNGTAVVWGGTNATQSIILVEVQ